MQIRLIEIGQDGRPVQEVNLPDVARSICEATVAAYQKTGFVRPWIGYLAEQDDQVVGTCAFKTPPHKGRVEIAYFTFPKHEGKGVATRMARQLVQLARETDDRIGIVAQTLPQENASTSVLRKLGFRRVGTAQDDEVGEVWEWQMSEQNQPTLRKPGVGPTIGVVGDVYRFLATGEDTNGRYALWEAIVPPGGGPPPHVHSREEEGFYILEGEITFQIGDQRLVATAGMFANMPVGTPHSFKNESSKSAKMLISVAPAGLEKMFFEVGQQVAVGATSAAPPTKADIEKLLAVAPRYGIEIQLPPHG
jgi:RimJ/RimL family protein N-acetyltransferase/quercetin dioxygenase-like cupin family protein